jgi:hypothetical protein
MRFKRIFTGNVFVPFSERQTWVVSGAALSENRSDRYFRIHSIRVRFSAKKYARIRRELKVANYFLKNPPKPRPLPPFGIFFSAPNAFIGEGFAPGADPIIMRIIFRICSNSLRN